MTTVIRHFKCLMMIVFISTMVSSLYAFPLKLKNGNILEVKLISQSQGKLKFERSGITMEMPKENFISMEPDWVFATEKLLSSGDTAKAVESAQQILIWDPMHVRAQQIIDEVNKNITDEAKRKKDEQEEKDAMARYKAERAKAEATIKKAMEEELRKPANVFNKVKMAYATASSFEFQNNILLNIESVDTSQTIEFPVITAGMKPNNLRTEIKSNTLDIQIIASRNTAWMYFPKTNLYSKIPMADLEKMSSMNPGGMSSGFESALNQFEKMAGNATTGKFVREETIIYSGSSVDCFVMEVQMPVNPMIAMMMDVTPLTLWIDKQKYFVLKQSVKMTMKGVPASINQTQTLVAMKLNPVLDKNMFTFIPPKGAKETAPGKGLESIMSPFAGLTGNTTAAPAAK